MWERLDEAADCPVLIQEMCDFGEKTPEGRRRPRGRLILEAPAKARGTLHLILEAPAWSVGYRAKTPEGSVIRMG